MGYGRLHDEVPTVEEKQQMGFQTKKMLCKLELHSNCIAANSSSCPKVHHQARLSSQTSSKRRTADFVWYTVGSKMVEMSNVKKVRLILEPTRTCTWLKKGPMPSSSPTTGWCQSTGSALSSSWRLGTHHWLREVFSTASWTPNPPPGVPAMVAAIA